MNHHHHHHNHFEQVREADVCLEGMTNWSQLGASSQQQSRMENISKAAKHALHIHDEDDADDNEDDDDEDDDEEDNQKWQWRKRTPQSSILN